MTMNERNSVATDFNAIFDAASDADETEVQRKIREAKAKLAEYDRRDAERARVVPETPDDDADDWTQVEPLPEPQPPLKAADQIHFFGSVTLSTGEDLIASFHSVFTSRGMTVTLTDDLLHWNPFLRQLIDDPDER